MKISEKLYRSAQNVAKLKGCSVSEQIEQWSLLGKIADENPDLTMNTIKGLLDGIENLENGHIQSYEFD